ncbi:hypothetical protein FC682_03360 [Peribacillus simplex]|uniref:Uncharacterized protein n=1 Tax=Peribacillus simplex TaxID=1478 RepID=A0A9X8ZK68_9BACI|nr:hypothetical protein [Peribacillus simplex]TKH06757.1 hypothetical protein FC682_03360 [Peribacillus simplex]TKH14238.1 hypothetical protein FC678_04960 [Peribacillus simplex]
MEDLINQEEKIKELEYELFLLKHAFFKLHDSMAPNLKSRYEVLSHGFTEQEVSKLDKFFMWVYGTKNYPSKEEMRIKMAEIKNMEIEELHILSKKILISVSS